jgi:hypothetical protein
MVNWRTCPTTKNKHKRLPGLLRMDSHSATCIACANAHDALIGHGFGVISNPFCDYQPPSARCQAALSTAYFPVEFNEDTFFVSWSSRNSIFCEAYR